MPAQRDPSDRQDEGLAGIHVLLCVRKEDVDGRDKPGHDGVGLGRRD
jgi:hypothetical protein